MRVINRDDTSPMRRVMITTMGIRMFVGRVVDELAVAAWDDTVDVGVEIVVEAEMDVLNVEREVLKADMVVTNGGAVMVVVGRAKFSAVVDVNDSDNSRSEDAVGGEEEEAGSETEGASRLHILGVALPSCVILNKPLM